MSVFAEVMAELWSMFVGDRRLTLLALGVIALAAVMARLLAAPAWIAAVVLIAGALAVLADSVVSAARRAARGK